MAAKQRVVLFLGVALSLLVNGLCAEETAQINRLTENDLQALNKYIATLSAQIADQQEGLETDLEQLMDQRRSVVGLEQKVKKMIDAEEDKLKGQKATIQDLENQLDEQKQSLDEQQRRLDELRAELKLKADKTVSKKQSVVAVE